MKKMLLVALAVLMSSAAFAQFSAAPKSNVAPATKDSPVWMPIGAAFTATDINGNTISLQSYLDAGKCVVIDYSCCWCNPCWNLHQSGILEALDTMADVQVIWVESESTNTTAQIMGTSTSQGYDGYTVGNWTVNANGDPIEYPIIDDDANSTCLMTCIDLYEGYVPSVFLITPEGYFCDIYTSYGIYGATASTAVANIHALMAARPQAGVAPSISINGRDRVLLGTAATYTASITSVDSITDITWTITNGTPASASDTTAVSVSWSAVGSETVTLSVTNTTGNTEVSFPVTVFDWTWGDTMSYCGNDDFASAVGAGGDITWAVRYPAAKMSGRNYLTGINLYVETEGTYNASVYQTTAGADADLTATPLYSFSYAISSTGWQALPIYDIVALDDSKDLWIVFQNNDVSYPASYVEYVGDPNGSYINYLGSWYSIFDLSASLQSTWMIDAVTSETAPAMVTAISGPVSGTSNTEYTFTAAGPSDATYSWTLNGATPATATGASVTATWAAAGTYTVSLTATRGDETATATHSITIVACDPQTLPFTCGFESTDDLSCWNFVDADGDGYGWDAESFSGNANYVHAGSGVIGSASYINNIGALTPDNWMVTPAIVIPEGGATLSWYVGAVDASYCSEPYTVYVSTTGNTPADFTAQVFDGVVEGAEFVKKSASLAAYAGQTVYIAFRHHDITDMYWMLIDDIAVTAGTSGINDVEGQMVSVYPNPATDVVSVNAENLKNVTILDMAGRTVMTSTESVIDMSTLANGVYMFAITTANGTYNQKVVKK